MKPSARARQRRILLPAAGAVTMFLIAAGCSAFKSNGPVRVAAMGAPDPQASLISGEPNAATMVLLDATAQGLISYDGEGQIEPGLAERWTVTADGRSYIFRIREARWPDGKRVTAQQVAAVLRAYIAPTSKHPLAHDFVEVETIHAMTDSVVEIRLSVPQPAILDLLAQPSMAIASRTKGWDRGWGPMRVVAKGKALIFTPTPDPLTDQPDGAEPQSADPARSVEMVGTSAPRALARFNNGYADAVIGGRFSELPYFQTSGIARSRLSVDPAPGLFGLAFVREDGFLAEVEHRAALAGLIRRDRLIEAFGLADWTPQNSLRPPVLPRSTLPAPQLPEWESSADSARVALASRLISEWRAQGETLAPLRIALPQGIGSHILFAYIAADLRRVGVESERVAMDAKADLRLIDEVAPNDDPIWALRRLNCRRDTLCSESAAAIIAKANVHIDASQRLDLIAEAESELLRHSPFIPIATPLRWSVTSLRLTGLRPNARAHHPLNRLIAAPK